jgi:hypothetical protein
MGARERHGIGFALMALLTVAVARADTRIGEIHLVDPERRKLSFA